MVGWNVVVTQLVADELLHKISILMFKSLQLHLIMVNQEKMTQMIKSIQEMFNGFTEVKTTSIPTQNVDLSSQLPGFTKKRVSSQDNNEENAEIWEGNAQQSLAT